MKIRFVALSAGLSLLTGAALAQTVHPPIEAYGDLPSVIDAELSPDGNKVALIMNSGDGPKLVIYEAGKGATKRADASTIRSNGVLFANDNTVVIRASEATKTWGFRGKYEHSAAITMNLESGKTSQLLSREDRLFPAQGGLGKIVGRLPDGQLLMPAYVGEKYADPDYNLLRAELDNGRGWSVDHGSQYTFDWFVNRKGEPLLREDYNNRRDKYEVRYLDGGSWKTILEIESNEIPISIVAVSNDETGVYFISSQDDEASFSALSKLNFDGSIEESLFYREGADIDGVLTDINRHLIGVRYSGTFPSYDIVAPKLLESYEATQAVFQNARIDIDSWAEDYSAVLYEVFDGFTVPFLIRHDLRTGKHTLISYTRNDIPKEAIGQVYAVSYPAADGLTIPAMLTAPPGKPLEPGDRLPLIALPHGGPSSYDSYSFDWKAQFFANRGYLVLQPNFRGSTGFGAAFRKAGEGEWGGKMQDDVTDGVKAMIAGGYADGERVCIVGSSYGGYSALAGGAFTPDLYKCVAAIAPVSNLHDMLKEEKHANERGHWAVSYWERLIAAGDASRDRLDAISPSEHAANFEAPVLLIHGEDDTVVEYGQSRTMERALEQADKPVELIRMKSGDHWLRDSETRLATLRALDRFVSQHIPVNPASTPVAAD